MKSADETLQCCWELSFWATKEFIILRGKSSHGSNCINIRKHNTYWQAAQQNQQGNDQEFSKDLHLKWYWKCNSIKRLVTLRQLDSVCLPALVSFISQAYFSPRQDTHMQPMSARCYWSYHQNDAKSFQDHVLLLKLVVEQIKFRKTRNSWSVSPGSLCMSQFYCCSFHYWYANLALTSSVNF